MKGKVISAEGKEVEMTENAEDLNRHLCEDYDFLRAGIISNNDALARAAVTGKIIKNEMCGLLKAKLMNEKPGSKFLMNKVRELSA